MQILVVGTPILREQVFVGISNMALVSSYRLTVVATEAVWSQLTMQVLGGAVSTPIWVSEGVVVGSDWYHRVVVGQPYFLLHTVSVFTLDSM